MHAEIMAIEDANSSEGLAFTLCYARPLSLVLCVVEPVVCWIKRGLGAKTKKVAPRWKFGEIFDERLQSPCGR